MEASDFIPWQGKVAVLVNYDGEITTAHILQVDAPRYELIADILDSNRPYPERDRRAYELATGNYTSIRPAPPNVLPRRSVPAPDICRLPQKISFGLVLRIMAIIVSIVLGGLILFIALADKPYGIQLASLIVYTAAIPLYTFNSLRGLQPFLLKCPVVHGQLSRLLCRHVGFCVMLFAFQTAAIALRPHLPAWWLALNNRGDSPFKDTFGIVCVVLAFVQIFTNRALLDRAHLEFPPQMPEETHAS